MESPRQLTEAQDKIATDKHRFVVLACGRKFGKTTLASEELFHKVIARNNKRVLYVAPTLGDARRLMWDKLRTRFGKGIIKENDTRLELTIATNYGGTSDIFLGSWELVNNYRGDEFDFIVFDEVQEYRNFWSGWNDAMRPTLTPRKGSALFMGTPKGFNHFYDLYNLEYQDNDYKSHHFTTYDNPNIPIEEIEIAKKSLPESSFSQEYLAEFKKSEGLVFKEFDRELHLISHDILGWKDRIAGVDFGFTNPAAITTIVVKDNTFYVTNLLYRTGMTDAQVAEYVANQRYNYVYPDPESPSAIAEMKKKGVNVREVNKGKDSIQNGINKMRELFLQNRLFIHTSCLDLIAELESYSYPDSRNERNQNENPLDNHNHAIDALRYAVTSYSMPKPFIQRPFYDKTVEIWHGR